MPQLNAMKWSLALQVVALLVAGTAAVDDSRWVQVISVGATLVQVLNIVLVSIRWIYKLCVVRA